MEAHYFTINYITDFNYWLHFIITQLNECSGHYFEEYMQEQFDLTWYELCSLFFVQRFLRINQSSIYYNSKYNSMSTSNIDTTTVIIPSDG